MADAHGVQAYKGLARLFFGTVPDDQIQRAYRIRVGLFFVLVVIMGCAIPSLPTHSNPLSTTFSRGRAGPMATAGRRDRVPET
jgi:hypothetical protein